MNLSMRETHAVFQIAECLNAGMECSEMRQQVGKCLLDLLDADYFASYVWDGPRCGFSHRVAINMSDDNLSHYESYFQYHDPITPKLQQRKQATAVSQIMPHSALKQTEFFNDFLSIDGLTYGLNFHAHDGRQNIGDIRIWRSRRRNDFTKRDVEIVSAMGTAFTNAMKHARPNAFSKEDVRPDVIPDINASSGMDEDFLVEEYHLTAREVDVCLAVIQGLSDKEIARRYNVSFTTVRTHIKHLFEKLNVRGRTQLIHKVLTH
ncbi:Putative HTH-type transcriptional regulator/MT0914 [Grimontia celer]|uniref:Putative HTH-type transcriptional regulator/MT0914 n=1 Tax=Grimontia celer TaxID=1796497 RepID=A0A128F5Q2_9GAMM|nr:helix-turn-helix transcriptional regulator [Grimontia celer]CZF81626.1 Putative HTH-type transcriptional regulator/MT0914 [Grimontia celer]